VERGRTDRFGGQVLADQVGDRSVDAGHDQLLGGGVRDLEDTGALDGAREVGGVEGPDLDGVPWAQTVPGRLLVHGDLVGGPGKGQPALHHEGPIHRRAEVGVRTGRDEQHVGPGGEGEEGLHRRGADPWLGLEVPLEGVRGVARRWADAGVAGLGRVDEAVQGRCRASGSGEGAQSHRADEGDEQGEAEQGAPPRADLGAGDQAHRVAERCHHPGR